MARVNQALPVGTVLKGEAYSYTIEKVLGQGSFGITYLATFVVPGPLGEVTVPVAVKEFFAKDLDTRLPDGSVSTRTETGVAYRYARAFRRESENLSKMKHPGIVHVLEAFEANGTYYYSMEYLSGGSLDEKVKGAGMPEAEALPMIAQIGEALSYMHSHKMIHLDLKPKNIMLKRDGTPVVIDFGLSKQFDDRGEPESSSTIGLGTPGYAPVEQANQTSGKSFQPTLDVYALGATLYKMLTGATPPVASSILEDGFPEWELEAKQVSGRTIDAIREAMRPSRKERPQSVSEFVALLDMDEKSEETDYVPFVEPEPEPGPESEPEPEPESKSAPEEIHGSIYINGIRLEEEKEPKPKPELKPAPKRARKDERKDDGLWRPKSWPLWLFGGIVAIAVSALIISQSLPDSSKEEMPIFPQEEVPIIPEDIHVDSSPENESFVDLGLPSGTLWKDKDEEFGHIIYAGAMRRYGDNMPSFQDFKELKDACKWEWNGNGYRVTGPNGRSITLLADSTFDLNGSKISQGGPFGHYWSSSVSSDNTAWCLNFYEGHIELTPSSRGRALSVRLVRTK